MEKFTVWILGELDKRGWQPADLARKAGLSTGSLSNILNGNRKPGPSVCLAIAQALEIPPEVVFRQAGILTPLPGPEDSPTLKEIQDVMKRLTEEDRDDVLDYAMRRYERQQEREKAQQDQKKARKNPGSDISAKAIPERLPRPSPLVERLLMEGAAKDIDPEVRRKLKAKVDKMTPEQRAAMIRYLLEKKNFREATQSQSHPEPVERPLEENPQ